MVSPNVLRAEDGTEVHSLTVPRTGESASVCRGVVRRALRDWHFTNLTEDAETVVTELVANSVRHARHGSVRLIVRRTESGVRIAVTDRSHAVPVLRCPEPGGETGRGLAIINALAVRWGHESLPWGKSVWADMEHLGRCSP
ncbi:ATP-binding protein [Streptomyces sp. CRN 30]|uniref:ATP-binding protein n=1 Tax=Streptomyces sp. CRN 30 TaxID=3075613 RepID=UPI002A82DDAD|nr:ATP-binding protein [Streptomyces sp. CRN 30]